MHCRLYRGFPKNCPDSACISSLRRACGSPASSRIVRKGYYFRSSDGRRVPRFRCLDCGRGFSSATFEPEYRQKKRQLNSKIRDFLVSAMKGRRIARLLKIDIKTVLSRVDFFGAQAGLAQTAYLQARLDDPAGKVIDLQFDEMESFEKTKCLPLSIPLAVENKTRKILGFRVCSMPAKGRLAGISRLKYGKRADERPKTVKELFQELAPVIAEKARLTSDRNPSYPEWIRKHLPQVRHRAVKGRRPRDNGHGELKKGKYDPLFSLNHTAAMFRDNISRLVRRTWATTKRADRLASHIAIYVHYHNTVLTPQ